MKKKLLYSFLLFLLPFLGICSDSDSLKKEVYKDNILPSPAFTYSPKTDVVLGIYLLYQFKMDRRDYSTRPSNINFYYGSSFKGQNFLSSEHTILTNKEKFFLKGIIEYKNTPEQLFGIGPNSSDDYILSEYTSFEFKERVLYQFRPKLFVGGRLRYITLFDFTYNDQENNSIPPPNVTGAEGGHYLGFGPVLMYDKRNSILTPTQNYYLDFAATFYASSLEDGGFATIELDARRYLDFDTDGKRVLAFQGLMKSTFGNVPFNELALLGGKQILRGYTLGRFRDEHYLQLQAEFRATLIGRFGATAFAGTGTVYDQFDDFKYIKAALGGGLRFNINRKDPANVRIDFAWSVTDNNKGLYITLGEAF
ncbi:hypothetical protein EI427_13815 [Flammeovirga pectinis]|uniref:Bacterial surface antigen (D15) domain-containing protein n=1 Tax=Flammeovirga pectinis TaxID=2494373 RepID=A0A3S9P4Z2_9BACT|nr:hypothetical protein [Flammeovirga pectinis]AZQ63279.1 hypothetical protein EI427_13815 [Flammeovirga pectinis]